MLSRAHMRMQAGKHAPTGLVSATVFVAAGRRCVFFVP
jgi:hypothetical protein